MLLDFKYNFKNSFNISNINMTVIIAIINFKSINTVTIFCVKL